MLIEEKILKNDNDCILSKFKLIDQEDIINFIHRNNGLLELIEKSYPLLKKYYPKYSYCLFYSPDPEIVNLEHLILFVNGDKDAYDEDFLKLRDLEIEIDELEISNNHVKSLLIVDV